MSESTLTRRSIGVVGDALLARQRFDRELERLGAGGADVEQERFGLGRCRPARASRRARPERSRRRERRSSPCCPRSHTGETAPPRPVANRPALSGAITASSISTSCDGVFRAEADRVNRNVTAAQRGDRLGVDAAGVVGAVGEEDDRADRQVLRFVGELLEAVADARGGRGRLQLLQIGDARRAGCRSDRGASETASRRRRARRRAARRRPGPGASTPFSASDMLRESSTRNTMMSCCGLSSVIVSAGCHSRRSSTRGEHRLEQPDARGPQLRRSEVAGRQLRADDERERQRRPPRSTATAIHAGHAAEQDEVALAKTSRADT